jgi:hypothetical protein
VCDAIAVGRVAHGPSWSAGPLPMKRMSRPKRVVAMYNGRIPMSEIDEIRADRRP